MKEIQHCAGIKCDGFKDQFMPHLTLKMSSVQQRRAKELKKLYWIVIYKDSERVLAMQN